MNIFNNHSIDLIYGANNELKRIFNLDTVWQIDKTYQRSTLCFQYCGIRIENTLETCVIKKDPKY